MVRTGNEEGRGACREKSVRGGNTREKRRGRPNRRWKDPCRRDMGIAESREDDVTNRTVRTTEKENKRLQRRQWRTG